MWNGASCAMAGMSGGCLCLAFEVGELGLSENTRVEKNGGRGIFWAVVVFFVVVVFLCMSALTTLVSPGVPNGARIGVVEIRGTIASADVTLRQMRDFSEDETIEAVLIRIDSPGGSVSASQELVEGIRRIEKPTVISMGDMAASGGYYVACAGPKIFANPGTLTGSIGVISQVMEFRELMDFLKVKVHTIKTGDLKDAGSPYRAFEDSDRAYFAELGGQILDQFVMHVSQARKLPDAQVRQLADGRVWTGMEAHRLGLVDELGGMNAALDELRQRAGITGRYVLVYPQKSADTLLGELLMTGASQVTEGLQHGVESMVSSQDAFEYRYEVRP